MSQSIKKNFIYSSILTVSNYLFPLIVFPYVSRVLGVTNIGICNFVDSIVNYFMLLSMMGISVLGIREISATKGDRLKMSRTFFSLLVLNGTFTVLASVGLIVATMTVPSLQPYRHLLYVSLFKLLGNFLLIEWFFKGLEDFKYITNRTIIVKMIYVVAVFLLVRQSGDYVTYYVLSVLMIFVNALLNCLYARRKIVFVFCELAPQQYVKPFLYLGSYLLITSMYTSFNVLYLGFVGGPDEVGYYTTATKLYTIILALFTAFTGVMMPRMSSLLAENRFEEFKLMIGKSINILTTLAIPAVLVTMIFSPQIIHLLAGGEFEGAITPARIVMPLLFIIGYEQILVIQVMMPTKHDRRIFCNAIIGALIGLTLNITLVPKCGAVGSSVVWLTSEMVVLVLSQFYVGRELKIAFPRRYVIRSIVAYIPLAVLMLLVYRAEVHEYLSFAIAVGLSIPYFVFVQIKVFHNDFVQSMLYKFRRQ